MYLRLLLLMQVVLLFTIQGSESKDANDAEDDGTDLKLKVGQQVMIPEVEEDSESERAKEANSEPVTDVRPAADHGEDEEETQDQQSHEAAKITGKKAKGKNIEEGQPPKYPLKAESAETSAHDNEIGGCRDHPRAGLVCSKCENGNKCFPAEHESYTYSYCRRSCRHCDPSTSSFHTFWRLRAQSEFEPTWMLQQVEFYADPQEKISLVDDAEKAYASSVYTGYKPSFAFDNNNGSSWYPSGWGIHDNNDDWVAYEFTVAVRVHGVRMVVDKDHATAQPKKVIVEASDKMYGPFQKKWTIYNNDFSVDKVYKLLECDVLWRRFEVDDGAWCFRLIAKLETWEGARKSCEIEGGELATISDKEEQTFITDEVGLCSHTWFGLSHTNDGYYWNDGSNSTFRNWKDELSYSDVQKQTLNCAAMDPEGIWFNFHCSNKFYFVCKKRLVPRAEPRPDLTDNAWPYPPEVPPLIFFAPNVTVPVINSKNLEPGIFPDANGKVNGEDEEEDITLSDLFYEQTVEHLKEKGLKPSEEIEADEDQEETEFTQELNKIAINTSPGDYHNETKGDDTKNNTGSAHKQEQEFEDMPNKEANNAVTAAASANAPKPKPKEKEKPVPPPPEEGESDDNSYPKIKQGKAVDKSKKKKKKDKQIPSGTTGSNGKSTSTMFSSEPGQMAAEKSENIEESESEDKEKVDGPQSKDAGKHHRRGRKKPTHDDETENDAGKNDKNEKDEKAQTSLQQQLQSPEQQQQQQQPGQYFYVPNQQGSYTLMRMLSPQNNQTGGANQTQVGNSGATDDAKAASKPATETQHLAQEPESADQSESDAESGDSEEESETPAAETGQQTGQQTGQPTGQETGQKTGQQTPQYFYMPNAQGSYTLMKTISPQNNASTANQTTETTKTTEKTDETLAASKPDTDTQHFAPEPPASEKTAETTAKTDAENAGKAAADAGQQTGQESGQQQTPQYFYMPNAQGSYTLMRTLTPQQMNGSNGTDGEQKVGQAPKQVDSADAASAAAPADTTTSAANTTQTATEETPEKAETIEKADSASDNTTNAPQAPQVPQMNTAQEQQNDNSTTGQPGSFFYVSNPNGTYTLMYQPPIDASGAAAAAPPDPSQPNTPGGNPPKPKEGDDDDDEEDSMGEPPEIKQKGKGKSSLKKIAGKKASVKNKDIPMTQFTGPLGGPSLAQQNISKSARKKIKVLQPLESAAHGEDIMGEGKLHKNIKLSRHMIHNPKAKLAAKKRKRNRHINHVKKIKEHEGYVRHVVKQTNDNDDDDDNDAAEEQEVREASGSGGQVEEEEDNADIFPGKEEFWSR